MDLLLVILVVIGLSQIGRGGRGHFKVPKSKRGEEYLRSLREQVDKKPPPWRR